MSNSLIHPSALSLHPFKEEVSMHKLKTFILAILLLIPIACSLPPERPVTEAEIMPLFKAFEFEESPEEVLAVLNKEGEVTIAGKYRGRPYWIKVLATSRGLVVEYYPRREAPAGK
jgi:hypothetical protein